VRFGTATLAFGAISSSSYLARDDLQIRCAHTALLALILADQPAADGLFDAFDARHTGGFFSPFAR